MPDSFLTFKLHYQRALTNTERVCLYSFENIKIPRLQYVAPSASFECGVTCVPPFSSPQLAAADQGAHRMEVGPLGGRALPALGVAEGVVIAEVLVMRCAPAAENRSIGVKKCISQRHSSELY